MKTLYNKSTAKGTSLLTAFLILTILTCMLMVSCSKRLIKSPVIVDNNSPSGLDTAGDAQAPGISPLPGDRQAANDDQKDTPAADSDYGAGTDASRETLSANQPIINPEGKTLIERINPPKGYTRADSSQDELTGFIRSLPLKKAGSPVLLYNGEQKSYQDGHVAVFDIDTGDRDLQQCADSVMRIYAEYFWSIGAYDRIAFHLTNGFLMEYSKWRDGNRLVVDGNKTSWSKKANYDDSYESFRKYLNTVFTYAGTISLYGESKKIALEELLPGDIFIYAGSPGHCVLVVDLALDDKGNKCFLLAQGYMPAQDFHILKNPLHPEDPWYYTNELQYPLQTPQWSFDEGSLMRWKGFVPNEANSSLASSAAGSSSGQKGNTSGKDSETVYASSDRVINAADSEEGSSVKLLAVGDNLIHIQVINSGKKADGSYNYDHLYSNLKDIISAADIAVINQETILGGKAFPYSGYPRFNSPHEIGTALVNAGFDVILQATNHTMDMGLEGVKSNMAFWRQNYPDIKVLGINESREEYEQIPIIEKNGIKLAMLNYTYSLNGQALPKDMPYLVNMLDKKKMAEDIKKAEELADFTIVFPHWGVEYSYEASKSQKELTSFFYDLGVDLVIGTHPHVLQPVEWVEQRDDHKMLVYYSLGNFISYQREAPRMLGAIAEVTITKDEGGTYISSAGITPIITHYENRKADYNYALYKLEDYNEQLAGVHGVSKLATQGPLTYKNTLDLAKQILGDWYKNRD